MKPGKAKAGRRSAVQTLDKKIEKQKTKLAKAKEKYETEKDALMALLKQQEELKQKELLEAIAQSGRTYEEVMAFVKGKKK